MVNLCNDQIVIKPAIARKLLKMGFEVKDIRPQKQSDGTIDFSRCVFLFRGKENLIETLESLK